MHKRKFGDLYGAVAWVSKAIAVKPDLDAYDDLSDLEGILQHGEQELSARQATDAIASRSSGSDIDPTAAEQITFQNKANLAFLRGDVLDAQENWRRVHAVPGGEGNYDYFGDLVACGLLHDAACAGAVEEAHPVPAEYRRVADILLEHFKAAAAEQAAAHALFVSFGQFGTALGLRFDIPERALVATNLADFKSAHALIDKTPLDCDQCLQYRGRIDTLEHNSNGAAWWFARAVHSAPSIPFAYTDWGAMLLQEGKYDDAIEKFREANLKGPHFADPIEMWGEALMEENHSDLALAKFEEANKYAPNWGRLHLEWGKALMYVGHKDEAEKQFAIASGLDLSAADKKALHSWTIRHD